MKVKDFLSALVFIRIVLNFRFCIMTEKEKMLNSDFYNPRDPELLDVYHRARKLLNSYNTLDSKQMEQRAQILTELLAYKGTDVWIEAPFFVIME